MRWGSGSRKKGRKLLLAWTYLRWAQTNSKQLFSYEACLSRVWIGVLQLITMVNWEFYVICLNRKTDVIQHTYVFARRHQASDSHTETCTHIWFLSIQAVLPFKTVPSNDGLKTSVLHRNGHHVESHPWGGPSYRPEDTVVLCSLSTSMITELYYKYIAGKSLEVFTFFWP